MPKESLESRVLALLDDPRVEIRCAAALVLGAAGKGNPAASRALAAHLHDKNSMVQRFVLDALEALEARGIAAGLTQLLSSEDLEVRERAQRLLAAQGAKAEAEVRQRALDGLYEQLAVPETADAALQRLRAELDKGDDKLRRAFEKRGLGAVKKMSKKLGKRAPDPGAAAHLANLLRLVGYIADPTSQAVLLQHAGPKLPAVVRLAAIAALRRIVAAAGERSKTDATVKALIGWADDADPSIARAAVDTLRGARIPEALERAFAGLARAQNPEARRLVAERVPRTAAPDVGRLEADAAKAMGTPGAEARLRALAEIAPQKAGALIFGHAAKLAKAGHHSDAFAALRPIAHLNVKLDDEQRLFLGVLGLKVAGKDLLRAARTVDPVLMQFAQLVGAGYPVVKALLGRKDVTLDDLFTLGFNFVESTDEDEKDFGRELLEAIVARQPRGKLAIAAKNKLKLAASE
jgi:hypothetical protein